MYTNDNTQTSSTNVTPVKQPRNASYDISPKRNGSYDNPFEERSDMKFSENERSTLRVENLTNRTSPTNSLAPSTMRNASINVSMVTKDEWAREEKCYVCRIFFDRFKSVNQHHCRVCGKSSCGSCSRKKINDQRVCDICFTKNVLSNQQKRRKQQLETKSNFIKELKNKTVEIEHDIIKVQEEIDKNKLEMDKEEKNYKEMIKNKENESKKLKDITKLRKDNYERMMTSVEVDENIKTERSRELEN